MNVYLKFIPGFDPIRFYKIVSGENNLAFTLRNEMEKAGLTLRIVRSAFELSNLKDTAAIISWADLTDDIVNKIKEYDSRKCILLTFEPPVVDPRFYNPELKKTFGSIFTMIDDIVDNQVYFKLLTAPMRTTLIDCVPGFSDKKLCVLINSNKLYKGTGELYTERRKAISFFWNSNEFDLYGHLWEGVPRWKGIVNGEEKLNVLKQYKFCICFENMTKQRGYISEKINEVFVSGCVPIYYGATNICDYVPPECFIDFRNFNSYQQLYQFMKTMNQKTYETYLSAAEKYLKSDQFKIFTPPIIAKQIVNRIKNL